MTLSKSLISIAASAVALFAAAQAVDVAPWPDDYGSLAASYVETRIEDTRGARVELVSEPYRVEADVAGYAGLEGWGVDVRVRSRLPNGTYGGYVPYTVIFIDGVPVALCEDASELTRV